MYVQDKVKDINERLKDLKGISNIVIWGAGVHTSKLFERTSLLSYDIRVIVDIDRAKQGNSYFGFIIGNPQNTDWNNVGAVVISVPKKEKQITETLINEFGFSGKIIILYDENEITPFHLLYDKDIPQVQYLGNYESWDAAYKDCMGYDDENIINTVIEAVNKVMAGGAAWERDGYLFYETKYDYQICAAILRCAVQKNNMGVRILDIGGSLGSTYFQNKKYLEDVKNLEYVIAEQGHFADYGHKNLEDGKLSFIRSKDILKEKNCGKFDIVLMSASLQYIPEYEEIISKIMKMNPCYIIFDRLMVSDKMRICKETVPEKIYKSSYPVTIFTESQIQSYLNPDYELVESDVSSVPEEAYFADGCAISKYLVFHNIKN